jgi:HlyD family secretion protein
MLKNYRIYLLLIFFLVGCQHNPKPQPQNARSQVPTVGAFGTLIPTSQLRNLGPVGTGADSATIVERLLVREGDYVRQGQSLALFRSHNELLSERKHLRAIIDSNQDRLNESQNVLRRFEQLSKLGAYPLATFQERVILYQSIANQLSETQLRLDQNSSRLRNSTLKAPFAGVITRIYSRNGEVSSQSGVLQMGNLDHLSAELEVYESDLHRVKMGQRVMVRSESGSFPGSVSGTVDEILPGIRQRSTLPTTAVPTVDVRVGIVRVGIDQKFVGPLRAFIGTKLIARIETKP